MKDGDMRRNVRIVHVQTGEVILAALVERVESSVTPGTFREVWYKGHQLKQDGTPNRKMRSNGPVGPSWIGRFQGSQFAHLEEGREELARPLRLRIDELEAQLETLRTELYSLYAGVKPEVSNG